MAIVKDFINVGLLREVVTFKKNIPTPADSGGEYDAPAWTDVVTTRGKLRQKSGRRGLEAGAVLFDSGFELVTRFQTALETELETDGNLKVVCNNRTFTVVSWTIYEERYRYYVFALTEQTN